MDIEKKIQILRACSSKKGNRCSSCPAFGKGDRNCLQNTMRDAATALSTLRAENEKLRAELEKVMRERDAAVDCIYQIEDDLDRGSDNDWAREHISEWESQKED